MSTEMKKMVCFSSVHVTEPEIKHKTATAEITVYDFKGNSSSFRLITSYQEPLHKEEHLPLLKMTFSIPLLNYGLFSEKFILDFSLSNADIRLLRDLNIIFSRDIFINKIMKRRSSYILPEFLPRNEYVRPEDANPCAEIQVRKTTSDVSLTNRVDPNVCGILSSGGKESLLTYAMLHELGVDVHPLYVNESGGHWRTALPAYRYHRIHDPRTYRVWTNIDRFYTFMLDQLPFIRSDHRSVRADTYPLRLCIFPFYIFALLPVFLNRNIGNVLLGSEFDDLRHLPNYLGFVDYYGVYDQEQDYDLRMQSWYEKRIPGMNQWSALRGISSLVVQRILVNRYPHLARYQRSCHSCHIEHGEIIPCGTCSKCRSILLFFLANNTDPRLLKYKDRHITAFSRDLNSSDLRLDEDEKNQSFYLLQHQNKPHNFQCIDHVERIHLNKSTCDVLLIPPQFRQELLSIMEQYTSGYCTLQTEQWTAVPRPDEILVNPVT